MYKRIEEYARVKIDSISYARRAVLCPYAAKINPPASLATGSAVELSFPTPGPSRGRPHMLAKRQE